MKKLNVIGFISLFLLILTMAPAYTFGADLEIAKIDGKTIGEWSAEWWQWLESQDPNPLEEEGPVDCSSGQSGSVWFLAGTAGQGPVLRECTVTFGKKLFFPLLNVKWSNAADENLTVEEKREILNTLISDDPAIFNSRACNVRSEFDGIPTLFYGVTTARVQSPPFPGYAGETLDEESVSDGFWVMFRPSSKGTYELHFGGSFCDIDTNEPWFEVDVTYILEVQ